MRRDYFPAIVLKPILGADKLLVPVNETVTVGDLKRHVQDNLGMPPNVQSINIPSCARSRISGWHGRALKDDVLVSSVFPQLCSRARESNPRGRMVNLFSLSKSFDIV